MKSSAHFPFMNLLVTVLLSAMTLESAAAQKPGSAADGIPAGREALTASSDVDEDFVIVSLLISDPDDVVYSRLGHAALHMQCPQHGLDYVFTYEAEDIKERPFAFLAGKLKMGMSAIAPKEYVDDHSKRGRGLREYRLNLPVENKRELWRALDNHLMEGMNLKYDYLHYGCAHSSLMLLKEGLGETQMEYAAWPEYFKDATRREITYHHIRDDKWTTFLLHLIVNGSIDDRFCSDEDKVIIPADLPDILRNAIVDGKPVIDSEPKEIVPSGQQFKTGWLTPMFVAALLLVLAVFCALLKCRAMDYVLLAIQTVFGIVSVCLVFFSSLCCTEWSWLIIPFNPLPLIFWKWRRHWALPYAIVLAIWSGLMFFWPHLLTDNAYILLAISLIISYLSISNKTHNYA